MCPSVQEMGFVVSGGGEGVMGWGDFGIAGKRVRGAPGVEELGRWALEKAGMGVPQCLGKRGVWEIQAGAAKGAQEVPDVEERGGSGLGKAGMGVWGIPGSRKRGGWDTWAEAEKKLQGSLGVKNEGSGGWGRQEEASRGFRG